MREEAEAGEGIVDEANGDDDDSKDANDVPTSPAPRGEESRQINCP